MSDWNLPASTDLYTVVITEFKNRDLDVAKGLDPALVTVSNPVTGMIRWTSASNKWQKYNGTTWVDLTTTYNIDVAYFGGQAPSYYAPINNPTFTGNQIGTTQALDNNSTRLATTQFVLNQRGTATPLVDGTASAGTSSRYSSQDHRHPTDTTRAPLASPTFTGVPVAPTAAVGTNTTQLATTAFVLANQGGPCFRAYISGVSYAHTAGEVHFNTESFDTDSCYNTSTYRFTPTKAGYYFVQASLWMANSASVFQATIFKNLTDYVSSFPALYDDGSSTEYYNMASLIYMNGTTDYLSVNFGDTRTIYGDQGTGIQRSNFTAMFVRN